MSEPNVHEQLAGMTIERDAALARIDRVEALAAWWARMDGMVAWDLAARRIYDAIDGRQ